MTICIAAIREDGKKIVVAAERAAFEKAAQKRGVSLSDWIRETLKSALRRGTF